SSSADSGIQSISIAKSSGLGLAIGGGANRPDGPMVYVQELLPDGDCYKDGRLRPGDQLVAINRDSLVGSTYEEARKIIAKAKLRHEGNTEVAFLPGRGRLHPGLPAPSNSTSPPPRAVGNGLSSCRLKGQLRSPEVGWSSWALNVSRDGDSTTTSLGSLLQGALLFTFMFGGGFVFAAPTSAANHRAAAGTKPKVALDPHIRLKDGKLELVLQYLGLDVSEEKRRRLRQSLPSDSQGTVAYGEEAAASWGLGSAPREQGTGQEVKGLRSQVVPDAVCASALQTLDSLSCTSSEELEQLQLETLDLRHEVRRLKVELWAAACCWGWLYLPWQRRRLEPQGGLSQPPDPRSTLPCPPILPQHGCQHPGSSQGHCCRQEGHCGHAEGAAQLCPSALPQEDLLELRRQLALAAGRLRTSEVSRKRLEICNRRLLLFVQV
ncbi:Syntaxin-binding protein 4, partial [Dryobates pubescens]